MAPLATHAGTKWEGGYRLGLGRCSGSHAFREADRPWSVAWNRVDMLEGLKRRV